MTHPHLWEKKDSTMYWVLHLLATWVLVDLLVVGVVVVFTRKRRAALGKPPHSGLARLRPGGRNRLVH